MFYATQASLVAGVSSDQARGANIAWFRSMTPSLTGGINVGVASHTQSKTISSGISLTYNVRSSINAVLSYQFEQDIPRGTGTGATIRNIILAGFRASF